MDCEKVIARLSEYYDGELDATLADEFHAHLANCEACTSELSDIATIGGMLKSNDITRIAACTGAPSWEQFASRLDLPNQTLRTAPAFSLPRMLAFVGAVALAASILLIVSLTFKTNPASVAHNHENSHTNSADIAIDFAKLLSGESSQPIAVLDWLSKSFDGREAAVDESEMQLGFRPSISKTFPDGVKLVSNRILKLPQCNCPTGTCSCGPTGCNCAASLCKRVDGTDFLVVEHCETQHISFGDLKSEWLRDDKFEMQLLTTGEQFIATWIADHRRLTAIGLNGKAEAHAIVASIGSR